MKYCLSNRQPKHILQKCEEIKFEYRDIEDIYNFAVLDEFKEHTYILDIPREVEVDWAKISGLREVVNLFVCIHDLALAEVARDLNIPWYWAYPASNWQDFNSLIALNPVYVFITAPISMSLELAKRLCDIPMRMAPNIAYDAYIPRVNGVRCQWVRPEDADAYGAYVDTFEFLNANLKQEAVLFHVYAEEKKWPGNLNLLLTNLKFDIDNRVIPNDVIEARMNCGQRCMSGGRCRLCETAFHTLDYVRENQTELRQKYLN